MGIVVWDSKGDVVTTTGKKVQMATSPLLAEAKALLFGMQLAYDAGYRQVEVETDCLTLANMLTKNPCERSFAQVIANDIVSFANLFASCSFCFAKHNCSEVAHVMAKSSLTFEEELVWLDDFPPNIVSIIGLLLHYIYLDLYY